MISTSLGIFWVDLFGKPALKALITYPELALSAVIIVYACIAYRCLKSVAEG